MAQEDIYRLQYSRLIAAFKKAFPAVVPPEDRWWALWMMKYSCDDIRSAISTLAEHPAKSRFTQESTGRAISALLRQVAIVRAIGARS